MNIFVKQRITSWVVLLLVLLNVLSLGIIWYLQFRPVPRLQPPAHFDPVLGFLEKELVLTQEQTELFEALREQHRQATRELVDSVNQLKKALTEEAFTASPDTTKAEQLAETIGAQQAELETLRFNHFLDIQALIEPEQLEKFQAVIHEILPPERVPEPGGPPALGGGLPGPPQEAVEACQGKSQGESCQFESPRGAVSGICQNVQSGFACVPKDHQPDTPPMGPPMTGSPKR